MKKKLLSIITVCLLLVSVFGVPNISYAEGEDSHYYVHYHFEIPEYMSARGPATKTPELATFTIIGGPNIDAELVPDGATTVAVGAGSNAKAPGAITLGARTNVTGRGGIAIGVEGTATGANSISLGAGSISSGPHDISVGSATRPTGPFVMIGALANANENGAVALGVESSATGAGSIAIGKRSRAISEGGYSFLAGGGPTENILGYQMGQGAFVDPRVRDASMAIGYQSKAEQGGIAIGVESSATGENAIAMGTKSLASGAYSLGMGYRAFARGDRSASVGHFAYATKADELVYGGTGKLAPRANAGETATVTGKYLLTFEELCQEALANGIPLKDIMGWRDVTFSDQKYMVKEVYSANEGFSWTKDRATNAVSAGFTVATADATDCHMADGTGATTYELNDATHVTGTNMVEVYYVPCETIPVTVKWVGDTPQTRPQELTCALLAGAAEADSLALNAADGWQGSYLVESALLEGTVSQGAVTVPGYETVISGNQDTGFVITNTYIDYTFTQGDGSKWTKQSGVDLPFTVKRSVSDETAFDPHFTGIEVDGEPVDEANYTAQSGSVELTLKSDYLDTLAVGEHTIAAVFDDGTAKATFTIVAKQEPIASGNAGTVTPVKKEGNAKTADPALVGLWVTALVLSATGLAFGRRR